MNKISKLEEDKDFLSEYPKLSYYLSQLVKCSETEQIKAIINEIQEENQILNYIIIEETLIDQIKRDLIEDLSASQNPPAIPSSEDIKSVAMIVIQTINKQLS